MAKIVILDYTLGNLFNVQRAFKVLGVDALVTDRGEDLEEADKIVLPGVGAFSEGMKHLREKGLAEAIRKAALRGKPILGICLGMQLLMAESEEHGIWDGLDLIPGRVLRLDSPVRERFKIPQIGWNMLLPSDSQRGRGKEAWKDTILEGLEQNEFMYFVHSYYVRVEDPVHSVAQTNYGHNSFCSVVQKQNIIGCQFHPERSGTQGLKILEKFIQL